MTAPPSRNRAWLAGLFPAVLAFAIYVPALNGEFVWDDDFFVSGNPYIREWKYVPDYFTSLKTFAVHTNAPLYRPLRNVSYLTDYKLWGNRPFGFHLQNLLWHSLCVYLFFLLALVLLEDAEMALVAALLFATHPVLTEAVCWIKSRDTLMSGAFTAAAFLCFLRWLKGGRFAAATLMAALALYILGLFSYLMAAGLIFAVPGYWLLYRRSLAAGTARKTGWLMAAMIVATGVFLVIQHRVVGQTAQRSYMVEGAFWKTMLSMVPVAVEYLWLLVFPLCLNADYLEYPQASGLFDGRVVASAVILLAAVAAWGWGLKKGQRLACFAFLWIVAFLLVFSNIVPMMQLLAERFLYLSCMGYALLLAWALVRLRDRFGPQPAQLAMIAIVTLYVGRTEFRIHDWRDNLSLHRSSYQAAPNNWRAMVNYGHALFDAKAYEEAEALFFGILARRSDHEQVYGFLAQAQDGAGHDSKALETLAQGIAKWPEAMDLYTRYALIASRTGRDGEARRMLDAIKKKSGDAYGARLATAMALQNLDDFDQAKAIYKELRGKGPDDHLILTNLAKIAEFQGDKEAACRYREEMEKIGQPEDKARENVK